MRKLHLDVAARKTAVLTYVDATGSSVTTAAAFDSATKTYKVDLSSLAIQRGSQVDIDFAAPAASGAAIEGEYLVSNTLVIDGTRNGTIRHLSGKPGSGVFAFAITPREGYQYDTQSLEKGRKIYWVVGTTTVTIPVPETLDYVVGSQVNLANNYIIQGMDMLERYLTAYDPAEDLYLYQLPNGSLIYADKNGNIARIVENGITSNVGNYQFIYGPDGKVQQIKLSGGISIDLLTGRLTVEEDVYLVF